MSANINIKTRRINNITSCIREALQKLILSISIYTALVAEKLIRKDKIETKISGAPIIAKSKVDGKPTIIEAIKPSKTIAMVIPKEVSCFAAHFVAALKIMVATSKTTIKTPTAKSSPPANALAKSFIMISKR